MLEDYNTSAEIYPKGDKLNLLLESMEILYDDYKEINETGYQISKVTDYYSIY